MKPTVEDYPHREKFWAMKFIRLITKTCVAQDFSASGALLLAVIATTEDAAGYRRAVTYYDSQLMPLLGMTSQKALSLIRKKLVDGGYLHYEHGRKGVPGRYWTLIPEHAIDLDDAPTDEGIPCIKDGEKETKEKSIDGAKEKEWKSKGNEKEKQEKSNGGPFLPIPIPEDNTPLPPKGDESADAKQDGGAFIAAQDFVQHWNMTPGVVLCRAVTPKRIKAFRTRVRDPNWDWKSALAKFPLKCFSGESSWTPKFDWFLRPDTVMKILEGEYDFLPGGTKESMLETKPRVCTADELRRLTAADFQG